MPTTKANVHFAARTEQYERGIKRMESRTERFHQKLTSLNQKANMILLRGAIIQAGSIKLWHDQEQAERQVAAAIRQTGKSSEISLQFVKGLASSLQQTTKFGDETTLTLAAMGLRMANLSKEQLPTFLATAQDIAVALGKSLPRGARTLATALADPILGIQTLQSHGVFLTEQQKDMIRTLARTGRLAEAQTYMLNRLADQYGGAARETAKGTGAYIQLKNAMGDLGEVIGQQMSKFWRPIALWLKEVAESLQKNEGFVYALVSALRTLFFVGVLLKLFALLGLAVVALTKAYAALTGSITAARIALSLFLGVATLGLATLLAFAPEIWEKWGNTIADAFDEWGRHFDVFFQKFRQGIAKMDVWLGELYNSIGVMSDQQLNDLRAHLKRVEDEVEKAEAERDKKRVSRDQLDELKRAEEARKKFHEDAKQAERERLVREAREDQDRVAQEAAAKAEAEKEAAEEKERIQKEERERQEQEAEVRREKEKEIRQMELESELEALRMRNEGVNELAVEQFEFEQEQKAEFARLDLVREEKERETRRKILEQQAKLREKEKKKEEKKNTALRERMMSTELGALSQHLGTLLGEENKFAKLAFAASKAFEVAELLMMTPARAEQAYEMALTHPPGPPETVPYATAIRIVTLASGYAAAAVAASAAFAGATGAARGGMVPGNPMYGDVNPYLLTAGEVVVPNKNYDDLARGILSRADGDATDDGEPLRLEADLNVDLTADAGKMVEVSLERAEVLST